MAHHLLSTHLGEGRLYGWGFNKATGCGSRVLQGADVADVTAGPTRRGGVSDQGAFLSDDYRIHNKTV